MTVGFISMIRDPWGGSEELWFQTALTALEHGDRVIHSAFVMPTMHPKRRLLGERGAILLDRPGTRGNRQRQIIHLGLNFIRNRLKNPFGEMFRSRPDVILYTGTAYSIAGEKYLHPWLDKFRGRFFILAQLNEENLRRLSPAESGLIKKYYQKAERVFFVSDRNRRTAEHHLASHISNAVVVRNPVNLEDPRPMTYPVNTVAQFAMVGNLLTLHKGQDLVIAALGSPQWKDRPFHLNIYGQGGDEAYLKELVAFYGMADKVRFHGMVTDISEIWNRNQMLLMPSHMEGMPLAVVEAMLCARAVLATDVGGITEWLREGESGFIAEAASIPSLSTALEKMWDNREHWQKMGAAAYEAAIIRYDPNSGQTLYKMITD